MAEVINNPVAAQMVREVRAYASKPDNYEAGWDIIVEAWSDADIIEAIGWASTLRGCVKKLKPAVELYTEMESNCQFEAPVKAYAGNVSMLHESMPLPTDTLRTLVRINVPGWSP